MGRGVRARRCRAGVLRLRILTTAHPQSETGSSRADRVDPRILLLVFGGAAVVYGIDQGAKAAIVAHLAADQTVPVLGQALQLHYVTNSGAAFSSFSGFTWVLTLIALAVIVFIVWYARRIRSVAWAVVFALILGGALGNATDRFVRPPGGGRGHVVDFIQVWGFPAIFNVADIAVCTAVGLFLLLTLRGVHLDGSRTRAAARDDATREPPRDERA